MRSEARRGTGARWISHCWWRIRVQRFTSTSPVRPAIGGVFRCLSARHLTLLIGECTAHQYQTGERLYFEGNAALAVYCIQRGKVKLSRMLPGGDEHVIGLRGAGDLIGYRCLLTSKTYCVTAETDEETVACAIPREVFLELLRDSNELAHALLMRLAADSAASEELLMSRASIGCARGSRASS